MKASPEKLAGSINAAGDACDTEDVRPKGKSSGGTVTLSNIQTQPPIVSSTAGSEHPAQRASPEVSVQERAAPSRKRPRVTPIKDCLVFPPDGSDPIDLDKEAEAIYSAFARSLCRDVVFELHRELHTGLLSTERLWAERLHPPPKPAKGGDVYGRIPPREPSSSITCPSCGRSVGAARYAPHLDKCALGSSRGRTSRAARSSPIPSDQFKPIDSAASASRAKAKASSKPPSRPPTSSTSSSPKNPPPRVPQKATARVPSKPCLSRVPPVPKLSPPPPPAAVYAPVVDKRREPLHILIKLVDGRPVQTYHRVVLTTPRVDKPHNTQSSSRRGSSNLTDSIRLQNAASAPGTTAFSLSKHQKGTPVSGNLKDGRVANSGNRASSSLLGTKDGSGMGTVADVSVDALLPGAGAQSMISSTIVGDGRGPLGGGDRPSRPLPPPAKGPPPMFISASGSSSTPSKGTSPDGCGSRHSVMT